MDTSNVSKDLVSYTTMISALFRAKRSEDALRLWNEAQIKIARGELPRLGNTPEGEVPSNEAHLGGSKSLVVLYNCVLHGLLISAKLEKAFALLKKMQCSGPQPDVATLNTFIRHYSRKGNMNVVASFLRLFEELRIRPDIFTFTSVLHACLQSGVPTPDAVLRVQAAMEAAGVTPNIVMYSAIIDQTVRHGGRDNIDAGFEWLQVMEAHGLKANEVTYTALLTALQKDRCLPREYVRQKTDEITQRMDKNGSPRNRVTFNVLIKASLLSPGDLGLKNAVEHYRQMVASGIKANNDTWYILLHGALLRQSFGVGRQLLAEMLESGFVPRGALEGVVKKIRPGEASGSI
jgi:pentatricopeptide repeat protein